MCEKENKSENHFGTTVEWSLHRTQDLIRSTNNYIIDKYIYIYILYNDHCIGHSGDKATPHQKSDEHFGEITFPIASIRGAKRRAS